MTARELLEQLQDVVAEFGDQVEVRWAAQPRWAFEYSIGDVQVATLKASRHARAAGAQDETVIYLAEGQQIGYLPAAASVALGWSVPEDEDDDDEAQEGGAL